VSLLFQRLNHLPSSLVVFRGLFLIHRHPILFIFGAATLTIVVLIIENGGDDRCDETTFLMVDY
jgi:hypothetical protein